IGRGEIVALVGESGSGKSTLARCIARLESPDRGVMEVFGEDVLRTQRRRTSKAYRSDVQMVFQDPFGSLNPTQRIEHVLARSLRLHGKAKPDLRAQLVELVESVGLPAEVLGSFPHRSEEHTSELQSRENLVCRLLLEKKKKKGTSTVPQ